MGTHEKLTTHALLALPSWDHPLELREERTFRRIRDFCKTVESRESLSRCIQAKAVIASSLIIVLSRYSPLTTFPFINTK